jgi:DNA gyrase subunit A
MADLKERVVPILIEEEMRNSYIDYSMSVIVARALPDVRDGLKPVHRRVLYAMLDLGLRPTSTYKKSARIVGEVLGKYHPHGDTAVYETMVRMVQTFSLRYPLVDGQGNFGSIDGDAAAAMRYTEARLATIAEEILRDIDKETVPFVPNFDETLQEPAVLPSLLPTLLVNGAAGIAVGMATNMPPHNINEVVDALVAYIDHPELKPIDFKKYIKGPDFPTGALIIGDEEIDNYFKTGRGKLMVRAKVHTEDVSGGRQRIVVNEIPYQVNKTSLIERVAELVREKKIEGIYDIRDESDREGMRIVFELRKEADAELILKELFKHSQLQTTFGVIMLALVDGQPQVLNIKQLLSEFVKFRHEVILRRTKYELDKAEKRAHILEGLKIALDHIDEIVALIKKSKDVDAARTGLMKKFRLSEIQAQAILDMRLQRLTGLERKKIEEEYLELIKLIQKLKSLLNSKALRSQLVKKELLDLKEKYGDNRRTQIITKVGGDTLKEMVSDEEFIVAMTAHGHIMRFPISEYESLKDKIKNELGNDCIKTLFRSVSSHYVLLFGRSGNAFVLRTSYIPLSNTIESFTPLERLVQLNREEKFIECVEVAKFVEDQFVFMATRNGLVKRVALSEFVKVKPGGTPAINLKDEDQLAAAKLTSGSQQVVLVTAEGKAIRFAEEEVRDMGISAGGIRGIDLEKKDRVVDALALLPGKPKTTLCSLTNLGFGKRSETAEYGLYHRGGKGVVSYKTATKVGNVAGIVEVKESDVIVWISKKGRQKRLKAKEIKVMGRATQGMAVAALKQGDEIAELFVLTPENEIKK